MTVSIFADLNPSYPSRGQRRYCVYRRELREIYKLPKQFNSLKQAERYAYRLLVEVERSRDRPVYLGD